MLCVCVCVCMRVCVRVNLCNLHRQDFMLLDTGKNPHYALYNCTCMIVLLKHPLAHQHHVIIMIIMLGYIFDCVYKFGHIESL